MAPAVGTHRTRDAIASSGFNPAGLTLGLSAGDGLRRCEVSLAVEPLLQVLQVGNSPVRQCRPLRILPHLPPCLRSYARDLRFR